MFGSTKKEIRMRVLEAKVKVLALLFWAKKTMDEYLKGLKNA